MMIAVVIAVTSGLNWALRRITAPGLRLPAVEG
jgi:iron(III) transport system permease protein